MKQAGPIDKLFHFPLQIGSQALTCIRLLKEYTGASDKSKEAADSDEEDEGSAMLCAEATLSRQILEMIIQVPPGQSTVFARNILGWMFNRIYCSAFLS